MTLNQLIKHLEDIREKHYGDMRVHDENGRYLSLDHISTHTIHTVDGEEDVVVIGLTKEQRRNRPTR